MQLAAILSAFAGPTRPRGDPDTWWHLATGELILRTRHIPEVDPFSWTARGRVWVAHEWATEVLLSVIDRLAGPAGLLIFAGIMIGSTFLILRRTLTRITDNDWIVAGCLVIALYLSTLTWSIRPHLVSILFLALFLDILVAHRVGDRISKEWWLIPLTLVWANLHAIFISGVVLVWLFALVAVAERRPDGRRLIAVASLCLLAGAATPHGFGVYAFAVYLARVSVEVEEWLPPGLRDPLGALFIVLVVGTPLLAAVARASADKAVLVSGAVFGVLGLGAIRNLWLGGLVGASSLAAVLDSWRGIPRSSTAETRREKLALGLAAGILTIAALGAVVSNIAGKDESRLRGEQAFPARAAAFMNSLPAARMVNPYNWGGYLIWKLPRFPVSVDGRADMYGEALLAKAATLERLREGWRNFLDENDVQLVFWYRDRALSEALRLTEEWEVIYEDERAVIFAREGFLTARTTSGSAPDDSG